jgi:hypothetical protein
MAVTGSTALAAVIEKRVSNLVTETLIANSVSMGVVKQYPVEAGMDRLDIPLFTTMTVATVAEGTPLTPETMAVGVAQLNLNRQRAVAWAVSKRAKVQSKINASMEAIKNGSREMAMEIDEFLFAAMVTGAGTTKGLTVDYSDDEIAAILDVKRIQDEANVSKFGRFIVASPVFIQNLLANAAVQDASKYGSEAPIQAGYVTRLFGYTIVESNAAAIPAAGFIACVQDATAFARQIAPSLESDYNLLALQDEFVLSHLYGGVLTATGTDRIVAVTT